MILVAYYSVMRNGKLYFLILKLFPKAETAD